MAHAPKEPTGLDRAKQELIDYGVGQGIELAHFGGGVIKGTAGLVNFVRSVNPQDPYNLTHPAEYYKGVNMTLAGLVVHRRQPRPRAEERLGRGQGRPLRISRPARPRTDRHQGRGPGQGRPAGRAEGRGRERARKGRRSGKGTTKP